MTLRLLCRKNVIIFSLCTQRCYRRHNVSRKSVNHKWLNRGSYMSAHVLFNLLNELGKSDKMRGLPSILSLFPNSFNELNKT